MEVIEALESLLTHPGWRAFRAHAEREWGPSGLAYTAELDKALDLLDDSAAASQARQIRAARKVIEQLLRWPQEELRRLRPKAIEPDSMSRRGGL